MKYSGAVKNDRYEHYRATGGKAAVLTCSDSAEYKTMTVRNATERPAPDSGHRDAGDTIPVPRKFLVAAEVEASNDTRGLEGQRQRGKGFLGVPESCPGKWSSGWILG